jgi:hypothetical protein
LALEPLDLTEDQGEALLGFLFHHLHGIAP